MSSHSESSDDSLAALLPTSRVVEVGGKAFKVRELVAEELVAVHPQLVRLFVSLNDEHGMEAEADAMAAVAAATTDVPIEIWRQASISKLYVVAEAALALNLDFFVRRAVLMAKLGAATSGSGPTLSAT